LSLAIKSEDYFRHEKLCDKTHPREAARAMAKVEQVTSALDTQRLADAREHADRTQRRRRLSHRTRYGTRGAIPISALRVSRLTRVRALLLLAVPRPSCRVNDIWGVSCREAVRGMAHATC
jgi:hypothetical protein